MERADGISRPLGSREIKKTKVETVLRDTLSDMPSVLDKPETLNTLNIFYILSLISKTL